MALYKGDEAADEHLSKKERKAYYLIRRLLLVGFCFVIPFLQAPGWCLQVYHANGERNFGALDCSAVSQETGVRYASLPTLSPALTALIDIACMVAFLVMSCMEAKWRNQTKGEKRRTGLLAVYSAIAIIDLVRCFFAF